MYRYIVFTLQEGFVNYEDMTLVYKLYVNVWFIVGVSHEEVTNCIEYVTNLTEYITNLIMHVTNHKKYVTFVIEFVTYTYISEYDITS